jgi:hypothetical protein
MSNDFNHFPKKGSLDNISVDVDNSTLNRSVPQVTIAATGNDVNIDLVLIPKGSGAICASISDGSIANGNKRGINAVDLQTTRTAATQVASGSGSFSAGGRNTASNSNSVAIGLNNNVTGSAAVGLGVSHTIAGSNATCVGTTNTGSGNNTFCAGTTNTASGLTSAAVGDSNTSSGTYSFVSGKSGSSFGVQGRKVHSATNIAALGDAQRSEWGLVATTTDATPTLLTTDSGIGSGTNQVVLQNNNAFRFKGSIIGKKTASTEIGVWDIEGTIVRGTTAATTVLVTSSVTEVSNAATWGTPTLAADTSTGCLAVTAVGKAATTARWNCYIETIEIIIS